MNLDLNKILKRIFPFIYIALFAYIISTIIFLFLPKQGKTFEDTSLSQLEYQNYVGFYPTTNIPKINKPVKVKDLDTISKYNLKAIYSTTSNSGWIIIEDKTSKKSTILQQFENFNGYILTKLFKKYIIFEKNSKEFKLELPHEENINYDIKTKNDSIQENIVVKDGNISVKRDYLNSYTKDLNKVWKDIAINDIRKNGEIEGFRINAVNKNSVFDKLGLKKGDIIKSVNGKIIKSYGDAFSLYNGVNKLNYLTLEVLRDNESVELNYEID